MQNLVRHGRRSSLEGSSRAGVGCGICLSRTAVLLPEASKGLAADAQMLLWHEAGSGVRWCSEGVTGDHLGGLWAVSA